MTLYPETKCTSQRAADIIEMYGTERLWMNSACDWGISDPLAVPKARIELKRRGHNEATIKRLTWDNPRTFLGQSPNFNVVE
jgi:predicted metal-dependent TIM-barrel fold hydrolase